MVVASNSNVLRQDRPAPGPSRLHGSGNATNGKITLGYVLQTIQDGYYEVDLKGNFKHFNRAMREMIGYEKHQLKGMNYRAFMDPMDAEKVFGVYNTVYRTGLPSKAFDWKIIRRDGTIRYIETSVSLKRDHQGVAEGFFGIARDVTQSKLNEKTLRDSETRYRSFLESSPDPIVIYDLDGLTQFVNPAFEKTFGWSGAELAGKRIDFVPPQSLQETTEAIRQLKVGKDVTLMETRRRTRDGRLLDVQLSSAVYLDPHGAPTGIIVTLRDITQIKRTQRELVKTHSELRAAHAKLKAIEQIKEKAINHISHELKTPIAVLDAVFQIILKTVTDSPAALNWRALERGRRCMQRLKAIQVQMDDIVRFSETDRPDPSAGLIEDLKWLKDDVLEEGLPKDKLMDRLIEKLESLYASPRDCLETFDVAELLREQLAEARQLSAARNLTILDKIGSGLPIHLDRPVAAKVFRGLMKNAIENTPDGGLIVVRTRDRDEKIIVEVIDFGMGITEFHQRHLFWGYFHTQETLHYATRQPYEFNAGGAGGDLLRMKLFAQRLGFSIDFKSRRCRHLPSDGQCCPESVSKCAFIQSQKECMRSGGSKFVVTFSKASTAEHLPSHSNHFHQRPIADRRTD